MATNLKLDKTSEISGLFDKFAHLNLFSSVDFGDILDTVTACEEITVKAGDVLLEEGSHNDAIFVVLDGGLQVRFGAANGNTQLRLGVGACAGELSILSRLNVSAFVVAECDSVLLKISEDQLWDLIENSHEFAKNLLTVLSGRVCDGNRRLQTSLNAQARYAEASRVDALTNLYNRRWLDEFLDRNCSRCLADGTALTMVLVDIDHFKKVNDQFGHLTGDEALKLVAGYLRESTRPVDMAARFGGEEFALVLYGVDLHEATEIGDRLRRQIQESVILAGNGTVKLTVSVGVADLRAGDRAIDLVERADRALYSAKSRGRNCTVASSP